MKLSTTRQLLYQLFNTCTFLHHLSIIGWYRLWHNRKQLLPAVVKLTYRAVTMLVMIQYCKKTRLQLNSNLRYHSLNSCNLCPCGLQHYNTTNYKYHIEARSPIATSCFHKLQLQVSPWTQHHFSGHYVQILNPRDKKNHVVVRTNITHLQFHI